MMIVEKLFFYIAAIALFVIFFLKMMRKNNSLYLTSLILQVIGIIINFLGLSIGFSINLFFKA